MRNQKLRDAALLLPFLGVFLMLPAVLRTVSGGRWIADLPSLPTYLGLLWLALILGTWLLSRQLAHSETHDATDDASPKAAPEEGDPP
jgi:hypothetical protein